MEPVGAINIQLPSPLPPRPPPPPRRRRRRRRRSPTAVGSVHAACSVLSPLLLLLFSFFFFFFLEGNNNWRWKCFSVFTRVFHFPWSYFRFPFQTNNPAPLFHPGIIDHLPVAARISLELFAINQSFPTVTPWRHGVTWLKITRSISGTIKWSSANRALHLLTHAYHHVTLITWPPPHCYSNTALPTLK